MAASVSNRPWEIEEFVALLESGDKMVFDIDGTTVRWLDGSVGIVHQTYCERDKAGRGHAFIAYLRVDRDGGRTLSGTLRLSSKTLDALPGSTDGDKSKSAGTAFAGWVAEKGLIDEFALKATITFGLAGRIRVEIHRLHD